jgi:coenzyme F420-reducing hydrogenase beta subunit
MTRSGLCTGCGSCVAQGCPTAARMEWDREGQLKPDGAPAWREARTVEFSRLCPFSPHAEDEDSLAARLFPAASQADRWIGRFEAAYVGHAAEAAYREQGSSGGMVSWVAAELLRQGLVDGVAHVAPADPVSGGRFFRYRISRELDALKGGAKSRYYPVDMSEVLREVHTVPGRYAVVGIPCFIKAIHLACAQDSVLRERIAFTLGLVCGHMKSRHMVESFGWQMGVDLPDVERVEYRLKDPDRPANWYTAQLSSRGGKQHRQDWWHLVDGDWGSGFFQNSACDFCDDVVAETADISFGDAWVEPYSSDGRGTNVVVVRSPILHEMLREAIGKGRVALTLVDAEFVRETQAAGFRQRREGLAYRLAWRRPGTKPRKRVEAARSHLGLRRKLIYRLRHHISRGSGRLFMIAKWMKRPQLFLSWGRMMLKLYHGLTYSRGRIGAVFDRLERRFSR